MPPKKKRSGSSKSKERKLRRKQEQEEVAVALAKVKAAYEHEDFMLSLAPFRKFNRHSLDLTITFSRVSQMTRDDLKWTFDLMKDSVKSYYMTSGWGWSDKKKWEELTHESACFLVARETESKKPLAFVNFRFDLDEQVEVVYCYEIHLSPEVRRKGVGKFLMQILELIGHRTDMKKVVLTVFKANTISNSFFREKLNYVDDETSPLHCDPMHSEEYTYSILSKSLTKKAPGVPQVAGGASQVSEAEGGSVDAQKATHDREERGRGSARKTERVLVERGEDLLADREREVREKEEEGKGEREEEGKGEREEEGKREREEEGKREREEGKREREEEGKGEREEASTREEGKRQRSEEDRVIEPRQEAESSKQQRVQ